MPFGALQGGLAQNPFAKRVDQARLLGQRDEDLRRNVSALGVVPAQQRFGADNHVVGDPHHRLVMQSECVVLDGRTQRGLQRVLLEPVRGQVGIEELIGVAPELLRPVHRDIGMLEQLFGCVAIVGVDRDADRRGDVDVMLLDLEGLRYGILQLRRDAIQGFRIFEILDDDHELVPAQPGEQIGFAQHVRKRRRDALQELVADAVSQRVVDVLEPVEVDEQNADPLAAALGLGNGLRQALLQQHAIRQARKGVAGREILQPLLGLDAR